MRWLTWINNRFRPLWMRKELEYALQQEIDDHLQQEVAEGIRNGLTPEEARYRAQRLLGAADLHKEEVRDAVGITFFETLARDMRFAFRTFRRTPLFAITAVITLGLGIGANSTVFTFIENILLRGPQIKDPSRVATLAWDNGVDMSYPNYVDLRDRNTSFQAWPAIASVR